MYSEADLVSFAAYRRYHGDIENDNYMTMEDCLREWKKQLEQEHPQGCGCSDCSGAG